MPSEAGLNTAAADHTSLSPMLYHRATPAPAKVKMRGAIPPLPNTS